jgi:hypothetical protein
MKATIFSSLLFLLLAALPMMAKEIHATIIYDDVATSLIAAREDADQLWITTGDLKRATRFEVKPQGVCRDELCFPLPKARQQEFLQKESGTSWFNILGCAQTSGKG